MNNIRNFIANVGSQFGTIKLSWDIPEDYAPLGYSYYSPAYREDVENNEIWSEWLELINSNNGWTGITLPNGQYKPNFNPSVIDLMDAGNTSGYRFKQSQYGMPNPGWVRSDPWNDMGLSSDANSIYWDMYGGGPTGPFWNTSQQSAPAYLIKTDDLPPYIDSQGSLNSTTFPGPGGMCYFVDPIDPNLILRPNESLDNWNEEYLLAQEGSEACEYTIVSGMHCKLGSSGSLEWEYDWNSEHQQVTWGPTATTYYYGLGVGPYVGTVFNNKMYSPDWGEEINVSLNHEFKHGKFYIFGRQGYNADNADALGYDPIDDGHGIHPSPDQIRRFIDPEFDSANYFHQEVSLNEADWAEERIEREYMIGQGNWYFIILYSNGHTTYMETSASDGAFNDSATYPSGLGPNAPHLNLDPTGPMGSEPANNVYLGDRGEGPSQDTGLGFTHAVSSDESIVDASNFTPHLSESRQSIYWFRSENDVNIEKNMEWPFLEDPDGPWLCKTTAIHWPLINGQLYNNLHEMQWSDWSDGSAWCNGAGNDDPSLFYLDLPLNPYIYKRWDQSYVAEQEESRMGGSWEDLVLDEWLQGDQSSSLNPLELSLLGEIWESTTWWSVINNGGLSSQLSNHHGWVDENLSGTGIGNWGQAPIVYEDMITWEPSGAEKPLMYYIRLDNEIVFTLGHLNVPDNFIVRIINMNNSGDFQNYNPGEGVHDSSQAPVFFDFMKDIDGANTYHFEHAPWWDFNGHRTLNFQGYAYDSGGDNWIWQDSNYSAVARNFLRIRVPWDTSVEEDSQGLPTQWKIIWGKVDLNEVIDYSTQPCDIYGGKYGMRTILIQEEDVSGDAVTLYPNYSEYSPGGNTGGHEGNVGQVMFEVCNTPPAINALSVQSNYGELTGSRELLFNVETNLPIKWSYQNFYDEEYGQDIWAQNVGPTEILKANETEWNLDSCGRWYEYNDLAAIGYCWDVAGNVSMIKQYWNFHIRTPDCHANNPAILDTNRHYNFRFGEELSYLDLLWIGHNSKSLHGEFAFLGDYNQDQLADDAYYMFSSNAAAAKFIGAGSNFSNVSSFDIAQAGYVTLEMVYNEMGIGTREFMRRMEDSGGSIDAYTLWWEVQHYNTISQAPFRVYNLPSETDVAEWDGNLEVLPGTGSEDGGPAFFGDEIYHGQPKIWCDPFLAQVFLKVVTGCMSYGKFFSIAGGVKPEFCDPWLLEQQGYGLLSLNITGLPLGVDEMCASAITEPFGSVGTWGNTSGTEFCDVSPGFSWDFNGGDGYLPDIEQTHPIMYWYNPMYKRWDIQEVPTSPSIIGASSGKKGELYLHQDMHSQGDLIDKYPFYLETHHEEEYEKYVWVSKKLNMTMASQKKMFYKIRVVRHEKGTEAGDFRVLARTDVNPEFTPLYGMSNEISSDVKIPRSLRKGRWIQIKLESLTTTSKVLISSITVIWRRKTVK